MNNESMRSCRFCGVATLGYPEELIRDVLRVQIDTGVCNRDECMDSFLEEIADEQMRQSRTVLGRINQVLGRIKTEVMILYYRALAQFFRAMTSLIYLLRGWG